MKNISLRSFIGNALIALVLVFTLYLIVIMLRRIDSVVLKGDYQEVFCYELVLCGILLLCALDIRFGLLTLPHMRIMRLYGWVLRIAIIAVTVVILLLGGRIVAGSIMSTAGPARHAIVLGLALRDGKPTRDLRLRLNAAQGFLDKYPEARLILTGGNADVNGKTEAAVMGDLLAANGVPSDNLILEDQAATTRDNFINTAQMIDPTQPVVLITSDYHMDRAARTAKNAGFQQVLRLPAPSDRLEYGANMLWEIIMEVDDAMHGIIA